MMEGMISFIAYGVAAIACTLSGLWIAKQGSRERTERGVVLIALAVTGVWCLCMASLGPKHAFASMMEIASSLIWLWVLFRLFGNDGRDESMRLIRPVLFVLAFVELLQVPLMALYFQDAVGSFGQNLILETSALLKILVAVGALSLVHNLYAGAASTSRKLLSWTSLALALLWGWNLNHYFVTYLTGGHSSEFDIARALVLTLFAIGLAIGSNRASASLKFRPSRAVAFQSLSLGVMAFYIIGLLLVAEFAGRFSGDLGRIVQVGFLLAGAAMALLLLPSERLRRWMRVEALKHLFKHRYDYRNEWIRFTHTIGHKNDGQRSLQERAIKSLADIAGCQSGLLLVRDEDGEMVLGGRWQWPSMAVPADALSHELVKILEREQLIVDFGEARRGVSHHGEVEHFPDWLIDHPNLWAAVPLIHHNRMVGLIVLARPDVVRPLDWEDFDLLSVAGQQVASYLAEQAGQDALNQASQFEEFNRRMAFVMHDIKNLSSQMSLLLSNAERHADNPEFRKDMLVTLRNSADKLNSMLARLGRYGPTAPEELAPIDLASVARETQRRLGMSHPISVQSDGPCMVLGELEGLQQALVHLVQNAIDASADDSPVQIRISKDGVRGIASVIDQGCGMSPGFMRNELFRPFNSSKEGGFGIGAYEARTMIRAMGGRLSVESHEGLGSRFEISLPLQAAAKYIEGRSALNNSTKSEVA